MLAALLIQQHVTPIPCLVRLYESPILVGHILTPEQQSAFFVCYLGDYHVNLPPCMLVTLLVQIETTKGSRSHYYSVIIVLAIPCMCMCFHPFQ